LLASAANSLARLVRMAGWIVAAIIAIGILLVVLKANPNNGVVSAIHDTAHWLVGPFTGMFQVHNPRAGVAVNWAVLLARFITLIGTLGLRRRGAV
jgi:hypothetical protein